MPLKADRKTLGKGHFSFLSAPVCPRASRAGGTAAPPPGTGAPGPSKHVEAMVATHTREWQRPSLSCGPPGSKAKIPEAVEVMFMIGSSLSSVS
jgi:hypothetical protein